MTADGRLSRSDKTGSVRDVTALGGRRQTRLDALDHAKGEVLDRYAYSGRALVPRNRMAYFFAVVEDRLGLKDTR